MDDFVYGSVCSGIEAATVAWEPLGWKAAFYSEVDRFPSRVLAHHCPGAEVQACAYSIRTANTSSNGWGIQEDATHTLDQAMGLAVAFAQNSRDEVRLFGEDGQTVGALAAEPGMKQQCYVAGQHMAVRRLTPRECERLQGFPDDYTKLSGKTADGPRYKALGNSMAVPVMRWIGERIEMVERLG